MSRSSYQPLLCLGDEQICLSTFLCLGDEQICLSISPDLGDFFLEFLKNILKSLLSKKTFKKKSLNPGKVDKQICSSHKSCPSLFRWAALPLLTKHCQVEFQEKYFWISFKEIYIDLWSFSVA